MAGESQSSSSVPPPPLPLLSLNHVAFGCENLSKSVKFYMEVLGFKEVKSPSSLEGTGAWLSNYGIQIHLLEGATSPGAHVIKPRSAHISFAIDADMEDIIRKLKAHNEFIDYKTEVVIEGNIKVDQVFIHDPNGYMIEICNCQKLHPNPVIQGSSPNNGISTFFHYFLSIYVRVEPLSLLS